jgi:formylglycine-generating enzyme
MRTKFILSFMITFGMACLAGSAQTNTDLMPSMADVQGGSFMMGNAKGNPDENPVHKVTLNSFYIGKFEVTRKEFKKFVDATGYLTDAEQPDTFRLKHGLPPRNVNNGSWKQDAKGMKIPLSDSLKPVGNISWDDAVAYCNWLSKVTGKKFRLPTEAEWEFAARGGTKSKGYMNAGSNDLDEVAWYGKNSDGAYHTGGQKMPNELGIYDMQGNMREWCSDWYGETYYKVSLEENPQGPERGKHKVLRGGASGSQGDRIRLTYRNNEFPYNSSRGFGFRVAISGEAPPPPPPVKTEEPKKPLQELDEKGFMDIYGIYFDIGKSIVKPEGYPVIDQIASYMKDSPNVRLEIEGHTDNTGNAEANLTLSQKRADAIKAELVKRGIDPSRIVTKGFGATVPVADNKTAAGRTQNRRVTIKKL